MDKQQILNEIRRTTQENGGVPLGRERFAQETGIKYHDWIGKIWARWGDALKEAGFEPNKLQTAYDDDYLIEKFIGLARELGRFPVYAEVRMKGLNDTGFPAHNTFARLGTKPQLAVKILAYCEQRSGYEDIAAFCTPVVAGRPSQQGDQPLVDDPLATKEGFVYMALLKLGRERRYKIGYWHKRFSAKNSRGEWFSLSREDIQAFKRRKFM